MDQRVQQAFIYATSYLQNKIEHWTERNNTDAVEYYKAELAIVEANFDQIIKESVAKMHGA